MPPWRLRATFFANLSFDNTWHTCSAWAGREDDLTMYRKGTPLHIEGRIRNIRYTDANGCERTTLEVVASKVERVER